MGLGLSIEGAVASEMNEKTTSYDPADDLLSDEGIAVFMVEAMKTDETAYIAHALSVVARAKLRRERRDGDYVT